MSTDNPNIDPIAAISGKSWSRVTIPEGHTTMALRACLDVIRVEFRYNLRSQVRDVRQVVSAENEPVKWTDWTPATDRNLARLRETIERQFAHQGNGKPLSYGRDWFSDHINAVCYDSEIDPFLEWLDGLPEWDGVNRLDNWLAEVFEHYPEDPRLSNWASRFVFLGTVERTYQPGCKLDEMPVFIGAGGIGKSTMLAQALPPEIPGLFSDSLDFNSTEKEMTEAMQGRAIVEIAEMAGATRADTSRIKRFVARQDDGGIRLAYRQNPEPMPRRAIIVGTSDEDRPLPNNHNLRRFVPIWLTHGNPAQVRRYMASNRLQLWSEAVHRHKNGEEARLPDGLKDVQREATESARAHDEVLEGRIDDWLEANPYGFEIAALVSAISPMPDASRPSAKKIGDFLKVRGYEKKQVRVGNRRPNVWNRNGLSD